jgi:hypothetical protein
MFISKVGDISLVDADASTKTDTLSDWTYGGNFNMDQLTVGYSSSSLAAHVTSCSDGFDFVGNLWWGWYLVFGDGSGGNG